MLSHAAKEATPDSRRLRSGVESILRDQEALIRCCLFFFSICSAFVVVWFLCSIQALREETPVATGGTLFSVGGSNSAKDVLVIQFFNTQGFFRRNASISWANFVGCCCSTACDCKCRTLVLSFLHLGACAVCSATYHDKISIPLCLAAKLRPFFPTRQWLKALERSCDALGSPPRGTTHSRVSGNLLDLADVVSPRRTFDTNKLQQIPINVNKQQLPASFSFTE